MKTRKKTFWLYGYAGQIERRIARTAKAAARLCSFAVAVVRDHRGRTLTPDLWA